MLVESVIPTLFSVLVIFVNYPSKLCRKMFEISLANLTARRAVMQNLWQEVTLIAEDSRMKLENPLEKIFQMNLFLSAFLIGPSTRSCGIYIDLIGCNKKLTWETPRGNLSAGFSLFVCKITAVTLWLLNNNRKNVLLCCTLKNGSWVWFSNEAAAEWLYFAIRLVRASTASCS